MADFFESVNRGFATINVKTANLKEASKLRTAIAGRESEIDALMRVLGETVYVNRANFQIRMVAEELNEIHKRYMEIEDFKAQIEQLEEEEKNIFGNGRSGPEAKIFCTKCGAPNQVGGKFCEMCGERLADY
ncbi:MAG: zinc ribbon domain-containing protein [Lachnospiraceae bacterium]|nr:zinc ribbon domain-containing protein [Lachnospiraceae bacterium]